MKKRLLGLIALALLPTVAQIVTQFYGSYGVGTVARILTHIVVPIFFVAMFTRVSPPNKSEGTVAFASLSCFRTRVSHKNAFMIPLRLKNKKMTFRLAFLGCIGAFVMIIGGLLVFWRFLDFSMVSDQLVNINVTKLTYPFVALFIVVVNPFIEEYFWRGFVFRAFDKYTNSWVSYSTGILFAGHHMLIIAGWFLWWQFIVISIFLALVGILFNWVYQKTDSIYATWIVHAFADLIIVSIGWFLVF